MGLYDDDPDGPPIVPPYREVALDGLRLQVPSTWGVETDEVGARLVARPGPGAVACVEVVAKALGYVPSMERHAAGQIDELRASIPGVHVDERAFTRLAGQDAYWIDFSFARGDEELRAWRVLAMDRNVAYRITYVAPRARFDEHDARAREIVASLELVR